MTVNQNTSKATIKWDTFDIGSESTVDVKNGVSGVTLNRIGDNSPSKIWGTLKSQGTIYLINHNGFVFGGTDATVLAGSFVASSLDITDDMFDKGKWVFSNQDCNTGVEYQQGDVVNNGTITSSSQGRILILGGNVTNNGTLSADGGEVIMGAATRFTMAENTINEANKLMVLDDSSQDTLKDYDEDGKNWENDGDVLTQLTGNAVNSASGVILADVGEVGIYGRIVRHNGTIQAVSTLERGSRIELVAMDKIITGAGSLIDGSIDNDTDRDGDYDKDDEITTDNPFSSRSLRLCSTDMDDLVSSPSAYEAGIDIEINGRIVMPSGFLEIDSGDYGSITVSNSAEIDLSGSWVSKSAEEQVISAKLNSEELRDEQLQQNGTLQGETIYFLLREGTNIGNVSNYISSRSRSALEQSTRGGTLHLYTDSGRITIADNASIDISGGGITYGKGIVETTILVDTHGVEYDISQAPDYLEYADVVNPGDDAYSYTYGKRVAGYKVGDDAGVLNITGSQVIFEGSLSAGATVGRFQVNTSELTDDLGYIKTDETAIPEFGTLSIGQPKTGAGQYYETDYGHSSIIIKDITPSSGAVSARDGETWLSDNLLSDSGLGSVALYANESITVEAGADIDLNYGSFSALARRIYIAGSIMVPAGEISLSTVANITSLDEDTPAQRQVNVGPERIELAVGSLLSVAGESINNSTGSSFRFYACLDGGTITLADKNKYGEGVVIRNGATVNADGGYFIDAYGALAGGGDAGAIDITGFAIALDGMVSGKALDGHQGGIISLHANSVSVVKSGAPKLSSAYSYMDALPGNLSGNA